MSGRISLGQAGRAAAGLLLAAALFGPWAYTADGAPPAEWCRAPYLLLESGRCVGRVSGAAMLGWVTLWFLSLSAGLITGAAAHAGAAREALGLFVGVVAGGLLLQPLVSTLLLLRRGARQLRIFHVASLGLAIASAGLVSLGSGGSGAMAALWGLWLYAGLAAGALAVEMLGLAGGRRPGAGPSKPNGI